MRIIFFTFLSGFISSARYPFSILIKAEFELKILFETFLYKTRLTFLAFQHCSVLHSTTFKQQEIHKKSNF